MTFPAVTICNSNRISCSQLKKTYEEWEVDKDRDTFYKLAAIKDLSGCPNINEPTTTTTSTSTTTTTTTITTTSTTTTTSTSTSTTNLPSRKKRSIDNIQEGLGDTPTFLKSEYEFLDIYMGLNESVRHMIGHQFSDFIKLCTFLGSNCLNIRW